MASTILHEGIHASVKAYLNNLGINVKLYDTKRLIQLYAYYKDYKTQVNVDHIYMQEKYIQPISSALRDIDNKNKTIDYYNYYAWDGTDNYGLDVPSNFFTTMLQKKISAENSSLLCKLQ